MIWYSIDVSSSSNNHGGDIFCYIDGQSDAELRRTILIAGANNPTPVSGQKLLYLTPTTHTIQLWWATDGTGTLTATGIQRSLTILEEEL